MLAALTGAAALSGCSHAQLSAPVTAMPVSFEGVAGADAQRPVDSLDRWWVLFDDAQLSELIDHALVASPTARQALERISEARAIRSQSLSAYNPQGALSGSASRQSTDQNITAYGGVPVSVLAEQGGGGVGLGGIAPSGSLDSFGAQFQVSYELDIFGRRRTAARAANADVATARFDYEATRAVLARDVASALFQARGAAVQLSDAQENLRISDSLSKSIGLAADRGLRSTGDAARVQADTANARAEVARLEGQLKITRRTLLALIGRGADPSDSLPILAESKPPPAPPALTPAELLRRRPDVREAETRLASAAGALDLSKLGLLPTFAFAPTGSISRTSGVYDSTTSLWSVALNATLPVLDRPRLLAVIRAQRARGEQAVIAYESAVQNAYRDAENGFAALTADRARINDLNVAVDRARFAFDAARKGYDLGLIDLTTLLDSERSWRSVRATLTAAHTTALIDAATLFQALGGGWTPSTTETAAR
jgi:NodT family efflux transporter outer membrane factor (OMF) lipoprotein